MADNTLMWERLDKNETIEELIRKINNNFSQFAMYNGGSPGQAGKDGFSASVLMNRCSVHSVTQDDIVRRVNELGNSSVDDITFEEYLGGKKVPDVIIGDYFDGDIIYFKNKIYEYSKNTTPDYKLIHSISGEKGDKGDTGSGISKFVNATECPEIPDTFKDYLFFNDLGNNIKPFHMIMMNASNYPENPYRLDNGPDSEDYIKSNSLIMVKENESTGIGFLKLNGNELVNQGKIQLEGINNDLRIENHNKLWIKSVDRLNLQCFSHESYTSSGGYISIEPDEIVIHASSISIRDATFSKNYIDLDADRINIGMAIFYGGDPDDTDNVNVHKINLEGIKNIDINQSTGLTIGNATILGIDNNTTLNTKETFNLISNGDISISTKKLGNISLKSKDNISIAFGTKKFTLSKDDDALNIDGNLKINDVSCGTINSDSNINSEAITTKTIVLRDKMYLPYAVSQKDEIYEILKYFEEEITSLRDSQNAEQPEVGSLPIGTIIMSLSNNNIKYKQLGYVLCDGSTLWSIFSKYGNDAAYKARAIADILSNNNRNISWSTLKIPDFTNRFPRGTTNNNLNFYETSSASIQGGNEYVSLEVKNLPAHRHKYAGNEDMWGSNPYSPFRVEPRVGVRKSGGDSSSGYLYYTETVGNNVPFEITPKYFSTYFYIKVMNMSDVNIDIENQNNNSGGQSGGQSDNQSGGQSDNQSGGQSGGQSDNQSDISTVTLHFGMANVNGKWNGGCSFDPNPGGLRCQLLQDNNTGVDLLLNSNFSFAGGSFTNTSNVTFQYVTGNGIIDTVNIIVAGSPRSAPDYETSILDTSNRKYKLEFEIH